MLAKKGKLLLLVLLILSLALMVGCDALSDVDDGSDDSDLVWEDYYSQDFDFGIKYPPEWSLEELADGIRLGDEDEVILCFEMDEEFADKEAAEDAFNEKVKNVDQEKLEKKYDEVISHGEVTIDGQDAYEVEFEDDAHFFEGEERVRGKRILTYKGDYLYVLEYEVIKDKYEQHENLLVEMVDSIKLDAEGTLPVSEGIDFRITALTVEPETVIAGVEGIEVTAEVQNHGDQEDEQDIVIKLLDENGDLMSNDKGEMKEIIDTISLESRESKAIKFIDSTFPEIESGNYTIKVASEDDSVTVDLKVVTSDEVDLDDAKTFANNLKNHGVDLYNLGQREADNVQKHFKDDVIPYAKAIGSRLMHVQNIMDIVFWLETPGNYEINLSDFEDYKKWQGEYEERVNSWVGSQFDDYFYYEDRYWNLDWEKRNEYNDAEDYYFTEGNDDYDSYQEYVNEAKEEFKQAKEKLTVDGEERENLSELETWKWELTFADNTEEVVVEVINPEDIVIKDEIIEEHEDYDYYFSDELKIDFTEAEFSYQHTDSTNELFDWSLEFNLDTEIKETIEYYNEWEYEWEDWEGNIITEKEIIDLEFIVPRKTTTNLEGTMTDNRDDFLGPEDEELPGIGQIDIAASVDFDVEDEQQIVYDGSFYSKEINYTGRTEINFREVESYKDIIDGIGYGDLGYFPAVSNIKSDGKWSTEGIIVYGELVASFIQQDARINGKMGEISVPDLVEFRGIYESIFDDVYSTLKGYIGIELDYSNFEMREDDWNTEDNYLAGTVTLEGILESAGYDEVNLDVTVTREGYDRVSTDFRYDFDGHRYIQGDAVFTSDVDPEINLVNEQDLRITIADLGYEYTIGDIRGADGTLYAYIRVDDEPYFEFIDETIEYLAPDLD